MFIGIVKEECLPITRKRGGLHTYMYNEEEERVAYLVIHKGFDTSNTMMLYSSQ